MWYIYRREYYSAIKVNEIKLFAATWVDLEIFILSEVSWIEKDKYHVISLTCGLLKKVQMILFTKMKQGHKHRKQTQLPEGKGGEGGRGWDKLGDGN